MPVLITEEIIDSQIITEEKDGKKQHYIEGTYLQSELKNRNGRFYKKSLLEREVARYTKEKIDAGTAWGELNHPSGPGINLNNASHRIVSLKENGNDWIGKAVIVDGAPAGKTALALMNCGGRLGVSSRGLGSLKMDERNGWNEVQDDFYLAVAADIVADPSAPSAFVNGIMEGVEWFHDAATGTWSKKMLEPVREQLKIATVEEIKRDEVKIFETFIKRLREPILDEESSIHSAFKEGGFKHIHSRDSAGGQEHTYAGPLGRGGASGQKLHIALKRKGYRFIGGDQLHHVLDKNGTGEEERGQVYAHPDGSEVHMYKKGDFQYVVHHQKHVSEQTIFETDASRLMLAERTGKSYTQVTQAWFQAKHIAESQGRGADDFSFVSGITKRMLGLT